MILGTSRAVRVFAFPAPVDLRKGYDGLFGLVQNGLKRDPLSGELFLFVNQARKLCKVLLWDGTPTFFAFSASWSACLVRPSISASVCCSSSLLPV